MTCSMPHVIPLRSRSRSRARSRLAQIEGGGGGVVGWTCCTALKGCTARHGEVLGGAWRCLEVLGDWVKVL